jgi:Phytanoyl-CoA dioxygenase (PhyH)
MKDAIGEALRQYREEGYAVLRGFFAPHEVEAIAASFDRHWRIGMTHQASFRHGNLFYRQGTDPALGKILRLVQWPSYVDATLEGMRRDKRWLALLQPLLGSDVKQIINQLHWKPPGATAADFAFHQDVRFRRPRSAYRHLDRSYVQTGLAIDPHTKESGALRLLPRSHVMGEVEITGERPVLEQHMADARLARCGLDPARLVDVTLEPGDLALWNLYMIHGSGPNCTAHDRRFYLNGYVRAEDCDRGEWTFRHGVPVPLGDPVLVHYDELFARPEPHYVA